MATTEVYYVPGPPTNLGNYVTNAANITWQPVTVNGRQGYRATFDDELVSSGELTTVMGENGFVVETPT
ncbi:MAG: hypothetical protein E6Q97_20400 [Desulfurellales bacterium]|nr:MAG: hypothetical protein E6Q97_20400 [Desulfurellales bacterium]